MSTVNNGPQIVRSGLVLDLDASYMRSYSPNVMPNPTNIFAWSGTGNNNCTLSGDTTITRQYGSIPLKMVMTGTDPYTGTYNDSSWNLAPAASGQTWTLSFYAKASETVTGNCYIFGANSSGNYIEAFATSFTVTTSWQRFTLTSTFSNASTAFIQMRFGGSSGQVGKTIWWDGLQVERASSATTFNPYYFGNTAWKDVSGNGNNATVESSVSFGAAYGGGLTTLNSNTNANQKIYGTFSLNNANYTWEIWYTNNGSQGGDPSGFGVTDAGGISSNGFRANSGTSVQQWVGGSIMGQTISTDSTPKQVVLRRSGTTFNSFSNGVLIGTVTAASTSATFVNYSMNHHISTASNNGWNGTYYIARMYNRTLSDAEVMQNYQATKTRFGL